MSQAKQVKIIGIRPSYIPAGWPIFNAPRPLIGEPAWTGDFVHGIFYAAIDPADEYAAKFAQRNAELDAWQLSWVSEDEAVNETMTRFEAEYPTEAAEIDPTDPEHREWLISSWYDSQRS